MKRLMSNINYDLKSPFLNNAGGATFVVDKKVAEKYDFSEETYIKPGPFEYGLVRGLRVAGIGWRVNLRIVHSDGSFGLSLDDL